MPGPMAARCAAGLEAPGERDGCVARTFEAGAGAAPGVVPPEVASGDAEVAPVSAWWIVVSAWAAAARTVA